MAQLKDLIVNGASRFIGKVYTSDIQITTINAPTASNGTTYGPGTNGQILKSNGSSVYWTSDSNSDTLVKQTAKTDSVEYKLLGTATASPTSGNAAEAIYDANITINPSTHTITATNFAGTATKATQDGNGNTITSRYVINTTGANDVNTIYNTGIYNITTGSATNTPKGYGYGNLLTLSYRKHQGNTTTDWASQIYLHNGSSTGAASATAPGNVLYYRTSNASSWFDWQQVAHAAASYTAVGSTIKPTYMAADGTITAGEEIIPIYHSAADFTNTTPLPGAYYVDAATNPVTNTSEYGTLLTLPWRRNNTTDYSTQLLISSPAGTDGTHLYIRRNTSTPALGTWSTVLDNNNYTNYTITPVLSCSTGASTAAKTVTCDNFKLVNGSKIYIKFTIENTANNPTLKVGNTDAKAIYCRGIRAVYQALTTDVLYLMVYDGTYWQIINNITPKVATCSTAAGTAAKVITSPGFIPYTGATLQVIFTNQNSHATPTLNINSAGAKSLEITGATTQNKYRFGGTTHIYTIMFDGTKYKMLQEDFRHYFVRGVAAVTYTQQEYDDYVAANGEPPTWAVGDVKTAATAGSERITLGNEISATSANGMQGYLRVYGSGTNYTEIVSQPSGDRTFYLPNYGGAMYAVHASSNSKVGDTNAPVYVAANGRVTEVGAINVAHGGTGLATMSYKNAVLIGNSSTVTSAMQAIRTASGAFYATAQDAKPAFGTLPIAQGGTGQTSAANAWTALGGGTVGKLNYGTSTTTYLRNDGSWQTPPDTNKYHKTGSWSGLTYTALAVNSAEELKFTVPSASTSAAGAVQLSSATNSTSDSLAATASAVKAAYDLANGKVNRSGDTMTGALTIKGLNGTSNIDYGSNLPASGTIGQIFFLQGDDSSLNNYVLKTGDIMTGSLQLNRNDWPTLFLKQNNVIKGTTPSENRYSSIVFTDANGTTNTGTESQKARLALIEQCTDTSNNNHMGMYVYQAAANTATHRSLDLISYPDGTFRAQSNAPFYGAVWNDYAEYRQSNELESGRCIVENGDGTLSRSIKRLQKGCEIVSDTFGFAIGESETCKTPTAATGRVLAYLLESKEEAKKNIGQAVCSGPNGTVSIMTDEECRLWPQCIIGTISEIPDYEIWHAGMQEDIEQEKIKVNGRIWIRIR